MAVMAAGSHLTTLGLASGSRSVGAEKRQPFLHGLSRLLQVTCYNWASRNQ